MHGFMESLLKGGGTYPGALLTESLFFLSFSQAISKSKLRSVSSFHNFLKLVWAFYVLTSELYVEWL